MARAMEAAINDELDDVAEKIEDAEARIAAEDGGYAAKSGDGDDDDDEENGEPCAGGPGMRISSHYSATASL